MWCTKPQSVQGAARLGDSYPAMLFSDSECFIVSKKQIVPRELRYLQHTQSYLSSPFYSASRFMNSFLSRSDGGKQNAAFFLSLPCTKLEQAVHCNASPFLSGNAQHKGTWRWRWGKSLPTPNFMFTVVSCSFSTSKNHCQPGIKALH